MRRRRREREKRQAIDFKEAVCCPSAVIQEQLSEKMVCARGMPGVTGTLEKASSHFNPNPNGVGDHTIMLRRLLIGAGAALAHLDSLPRYDLAILTDGFVFWKKAAVAYLLTALSVALRPLFPFQQAKYAQVFLLKSAPFCTLFAGLSSINKSAISLLLSDSRSVLATLSSPPSFLLFQTL